ncbi:two-component response regulator ARR1-like [Salvia hispanica]|uniref:two-component response regulator ARR1-like n=1 Tax=Salvia hispanica TaxID=49212 RepID=UPI0020097DF1|nr:two-component response regulator ARR1-like [Salvia hispanica]
MASFHAMMHGIHILLVDHDAEALINTAKQLELCQYKVTFVEHASAAIAMLATGKAKFDVVMANIDSPDLHGFKLLQHAVYMCIPVVLMSEDDDAFIAMRALEHGAFLHIKKPMSMEFSRCLWQHVVREKTRMARDRNMFMASNNLGPIQGVEFREAVQLRDENPNPNPSMKNKGKYKSKARGRSDDYGEEYDSGRMGHKGNVRRKMCTEWTQELHAKFMNAIEQLGEGRCFPKEILEMMNEPGLTRMQVASHLQKCRNDNWRAPEERKSTPHPQQASSSGSGPQSKPRRFGSKPLPLSETQTPSKMGNGSIPASDDYLHFLDMDSLTPTTNQQNCGEATSQSKSAWSSDTSNLDSDHSETKAKP